MITKSKKDVFSFKGKAHIVNTVNTEKIMGKGIAKEFKLRYPEYFENYVHSNINKGGDIAFFNNIISFATKEKWKNKSKLKWSETGLASLKEHAIEKDIKVIVSPYLGCGNGGLKETDVLKLIKKYFEDSNIKFIISLGIEDGEYYQKQLQDIIKTAKEGNQFTEKINEGILDYWKFGKLKLFRDLQKVPGLGDKMYQKMLNMDFDALKLF